MEDGYITQLEKLPPHARLKQPRQLKEEDDDYVEHLQKVPEQIPSVNEQKVNEVPQEVFDAMKVNGSLGSFHSFDGDDTENENELRDHMQLAKLSHSLYYFGQYEDEDLQTDANESPATSKDSFKTKKVTTQVQPKDDPQRSGITRSIGRSDGRSYRSYEGTKLDWIKEFLTITEKIESGDANYEDYRNLADLANNFLEVAKTYGKIIISEVALPLEKKTIKPRDFGGSAGGEKYAVGNIFFKFALDWKNYYGGDEYVMKAAGHELKGLMAVYQSQIPKLHVPLMALIDYKGYRLIAVSMLPITSNTLVYGASDGGKTVHADDPEICEIMANMAKKLNLAAHYAGFGARKKLIYGPTDIEVHKADSRFFMCDFARIFPPEARVSKGRKGTFLYKILRPELVRRNQVPLNSDGFSKFSDNPESNRDIQTATVNLLETVIPNFAFDISKSGIAINKLIDNLHRRGINCRYLGLVRSYAYTYEVRSIILNECTARIIKNLIRKRMRNLLTAQKYALETFFKKDLLGFLNMLGGRLEESESFWKKDVKILIQETFPPCLTTEELEDSYDIRKLISFYNLLLRVQQMTGLSIDNAIMREIYGDPFNKFELVEADILALPERTKHMTIVDYAEATALYIQSTMTKNSSHKQRLFDLAMKRFESAVAVWPSSILTLTAWGDALHSQYVETGDEKFFNQAVDKYRLAENKERLLQLASDYVAKLLKCSGFGSAKPHLIHAEFLYQSAIECSFTEVHQTHLLLARLYHDSVKRFNQKQYLPLAGAQYRKAIGAKPDDYSSQLIEITPKLNDENLANLMEICQRNNSISGSNISVLDYRWSDVNLKMAVQVISHFKTIKHVFLNKMKSLMDSELLEIIQNSPALETLEMQGCSLLTDSSLSKIASYCPSLKNLELRGCYLITDSSISTFTSLKQLENFGVDCYNSKDSVIQSVIKSCNNLKHLKFNYCVKLSLETAISIATLLPEITVLYFKWYPALNDSAIKEFEKLPLERISLRYVHNVSEQAIVSLYNHCPLLRKIDLTGTFLSIQKQLRNRVIELTKKPYKDDLVKKGLSLSNKSITRTGTLSYKQSVTISKFLSQSLSCTRIEFNNCDFLNNFQMIVEAIAVARSLTEVVFVNLKIGDEGITSLMRALARNKMRMKFETLIVNNCEFGAQGLSEILENFRGLNLDLKYCNINLEGCKLIKNFLAKALEPEKEFQPKSLILSHNKFGDNGLEEIMDGLRGTFIEKKNLIKSEFCLELKDCGIGPQGAAFISNSLKLNPNLGILRLQDNQLGDEGIGKLVEGLSHNHQLTELNLDNNGISDSGITALCCCLDNSLSILSLNSNKIVGDGVIDFAQAILGPNSLTQLSLVSNPLNIKAVQSLTIALKESKLEKLVMSFGDGDMESQFEDALVDLICESISSNCTVNLGSIGSSIQSKAKLRYPSYLREQKAKQQNEKKTVVNEWQFQIRSNSLAKYLQRKDAEKK